MFSEKYVHCIVQQFHWDPQAWYLRIADAIPLTQETLCDVIDAALAHDPFRTPRLCERVSECIEQHPEWLERLPVAQLVKLSPHPTPVAVTALVAVRPAYAFYLQIRAVEGEQLLAAIRAQWPTSSVEVWIDCIRAAAIWLEDIPEGISALTSWYPDGAAYALRAADAADGATGVAVLERIEHALKEAQLPLRHWHIAVHTTAARLLDNSVTLALRGPEGRVEQLPVRVLQEALGWGEEYKEMATVEGINSDGWALPDMASPTFNALVRYIVDERCDFEQAMLVDLFVAADYLNAPALQAAVVARAGWFIRSGSSSADQVWQEVVCPLYELNKRLANDVDLNPLLALCLNARTLPDIISSVSPHELHRSREVWQRVQSLIVTHPNCLGRERLMEQLALQQYLSPPAEAALCKTYPEFAAAVVEKVTQDIERAKRELLAAFKESVPDLFEPPSPKGEGFLLQRSPYGAAPQALSTVVPTARKFSAAL